MATFYRMEKAVMTGLIGSGAFLTLSMPNSVPNIPVGTLFEIIDKSEKTAGSWSISLVNMQYARVSTTEGGSLLPGANYHVMLGRTPAETVKYAQKLSEEFCGEDGFELMFEEKGVIDEALTNGRSIMKMMGATSSQFIAQKYATLA
jgi:hypothetical protein